jgi:hypothetical protein
LAAAFLAVTLLFAVAADYFPAFHDAAGKDFSLFAPDICKNALHVAR